jgi:lambda repressor-like predicted transcriptional regulator
MTINPGEVFMANAEEIRSSRAFVNGFDAFHAYLECSDKIQAAVRDMMEIARDPESTEDEKEMAIATIADALFPQPHEGILGMDLEESEKMGGEHSDEMARAINELDREEEIFAERLLAIMRQKEITQEDLARSVGVGQPAISMMLSRKCRPQRRTIIRLSQSLGVKPNELWPSFG